MKHRRWTWIIILLLIFGLWYNHRYGMNTAKAKTYNDPSIETRLLIATQGSKYKDQLTKMIVDKFLTNEIYINVMDISDLAGENAFDYNAVVIAHTWEVWMMPLEVKQFVKRSDKDLLFIVSTSGSGELMIDGLDGISTASSLDGLNDDFAQLIKWLEPKLANPKTFISNQET